jgi:hypothetical protein
MNSTDPERFGAGALNGGNPWKPLVAFSNDMVEHYDRTEVMEVPGGVVIRVTNQLLNPAPPGHQHKHDTWALSEAMTFVPGVRVEEIVEHGQVINRRLVPLETALTDLARTEKFFCTLRLAYTLMEEVWACDEANCYNLTRGDAYLAIALDKGVDSDKAETRLLFSTSGQFLGYGTWM